MNIGIAVTTTPNREKVFNEWYQNYAKYSPELPLYIHLDQTYKGVGPSKNECLKVLYEEGFDHFLLFDDDCFINAPLWYLHYVTSGLEHACYTFNRQLLAQHETYNEFVDPNGCMLYFTRKCIDTVGGWDLSFKGYGYEHSNISCRAFNAGLIPARFIDVKRPNYIFKMADCESSFTSADRAQIPSNYKLYQEKFNSKDFIPYK